VHTCLLPGEAALNRETTAELLTLVPGRPVLTRERPIATASSPAKAVGVDCEIPSARRATLHGVGTVTTNAVVTGGRILQSTARAQFVPAASASRRTWAHYLNRVGVIEVLSKIPKASARAGTPEQDVAAGFLDATGGAQTLDLAAIAARLLSTVRMDHRLDRRAPILAATTRMRWAATISRQEPQISFRKLGRTDRAVEIHVRDEQELALAARFGEELALHDWLLTTLTDLIEESERHPLTSADAVDLLSAMTVHLAHLWMPQAHTPRPLRPLWDALETDAGFTRQWVARTGQLRDRLTVVIAQALRNSRISTTDW
jgi:hypothetical protein